MPFVVIKSTKLEPVLIERLEFNADRDIEVFAAVPAGPAVFLLRGENPEAEPYVSKTANLRRRLQRLLGPVTDRTKKLNLRDRVRSIEYSATGSDFESGFLLYRVLREAFPKTYQNHLRFRFAPFVKMHLENEYPRASITTRLGRLDGRALYFGPFFSRLTAEKFMNDSLDFFKMRRCVDDLKPDPKFPGCVYSEMKMCLAPCFKGCTDEEYALEVTKVREFFETGGQSLLRETAMERDKASEEMHFETAALVHAKLEKLKPVITQLPEIVRPIDRLSALMVQPSAEPGSVTLFRIDAGRFSSPIQLSLNVAQEGGGKPLSMEARIHELLGAIEVSPTSAQETMEHLAILKRWFYRTTKSGELFLADERGDLPWRRIVRGVTRVFKGEKEAP